MPPPHRRSKPPPGVRLLSDTWIVDGPAFKHALASGMPWGGATRKFALTRETCPGLPGMLATLGP